MLTADEYRALQMVAAHGGHYGVVRLHLDALFSRKPSLRQWAELKSSLKAKGLVQSNGDFLTRAGHWFLHNYQK